MAEPPTKRRRLNMRDAFVALVGHKKKEFILYTEVATRSSTFFHRAMTNRSWKESLDKQVSLWHVEEHDFEGYLQWLNTGELTYAAGNPSFDELADFHILGDFLDDQGFRHVTLNGFAEHSCAMACSPGPALIKRIWTKTPENCPLRRLVLEIWCQASLRQSIRMLRIPENGLPEDFALDYLDHLVETHRIDKKGTSIQQHKKDVKDYVQGLIVESAAKPSAQADACDDKDT